MRHLCHDQVSVLHEMAMLIYSSDDVFEAGYPSEDLKISALYDRLLLYDHAALRIST